MMKLGHNLTYLCAPYAMLILKSTLTFSNVIWVKMVFSISHHVLTHHLKIVSPQGKIDTLRLPTHSCFKCKFLNLFGLMLFLQFALSSIACFHMFMVTLLMVFFSLLSCFLLNLEYLAIFVLLEVFVPW